MGTHGVTVSWQRDGASFVDQRYSRRHEWRFDGGAVVPGSASPSVVAPPMSDPAAVDPEEAYVASISSCHMLWFLSLAASAGFVVDSYSDEAVGHLVESTEDPTHVELVELHPRVAYSGTPPSAEDEARLHHEAHARCFIANSVKTRIETVLTNA